MMSNSMNPATARILQMAEHRPGLSDRREHSHFPVTEELRYRVLHPKSVEAGGSGVTVNISSSGVCFTTEGQLPEGRMVELSVNWPARIDGTCPLKFVVLGRVIRSEDFLAAVRIEKYEFKTRRIES